jgi:hypothetical protein
MLDTSKKKNLNNTLLHCGRGDEKTQWYWLSTNQTWTYSQLSRERHSAKMNIHVKKRRWHPALHLRAPWRTLQDSNCCVTDQFSQQTAFSQSRKM